MADVGLEEGRLEGNERTSPALAEAGDECEEGTLAVVETAAGAVSEGATAWFDCGG